MKQEIRQDVVINGEIAIKPYFYVRNGILHVRYNVDRAIILTPEEKEQLIQDIKAAPELKQNILHNLWDTLQNIKLRNVRQDGIKLIQELFIQD